MQEVATAQRSVTRSECRQMLSSHKRTFVEAELNLNPNQLVLTQLTYKTTQVA